MSTVVSSSIAGLVVVALTLALPASALAQAPDLKYFTTFTLTGDYVVAGVDLQPQSQSNGLVTGTIQVSGVPANADIVAAYLYWETIASNPSQLSGALFRGEPVSAIKTSSVALTGPYATCYANGGNTLSMMRADVRRLLPPQLDANGQPTGKRVVNHADLQKYQQQFPDDKWLLTVSLPDGGTGQLPQSAGATLVIVYRNPDPQPGDPAQRLQSIVVYDGVHIQTPGELTVHTLRGFVQSSVSTPQAKYTPILGSGVNNTTDRVWFKSGILFGLLGVDLIPGSSTSRAWSNTTFPLTLSEMSSTFTLPYGEEVQTRIDHTTENPFDCVSWAAEVFSTAVQDVDGDGLVDQLESVSGLKTPSGEDLPDLAAMGAVVGQRDLFLEIGAMENHGATSAPHSHMPSANVLKQVGDALANPPAGAAPIAVHFDVGPTLGAAYRAALQPSGADRYIITTGATGGERIEEKIFSRFPTTPGVVSWPTGFQMYVQSPVAADGSELTPAQIAACFDTGTSGNPGTGVNNCRRRFDKARQGLFHYVLYAHARGIPRSEFPCVDAAGKPVPVGPSGSCVVAPNPDFYLPKSVSGVGELPGRFFMVTLGLWDALVGTEFMQASTTLHELGHNLGLWHGGAAPQFTNLSNARANTFVQPNCKPNYPSIMSYLFQAHGVTDYLGKTSARYSAEIVDPLNEAGLSDTALTPTQLFKTAWYTPIVPGTFGYTFHVAAAKKHCNGTPLFLDASGNPTELPMGRVDASSPVDPIDWNGAAGVYLAGRNSQDINFDGIENGQPATLTSFNDWSNIRMNQPGAGRNMAGMSLGLDFGGLDFGGLDFGGLDFGGLDFGGLDFGGLDFGGLDFGGLDFGGLDFGGLDFGGLDFGGLDFGGLDFGGLDFGGLDFGGAELDYFDVISSGGTPPTQMSACVIGGVTGSPVCTTGPATPLHRDRLSWQAPNVGTVDSYTARRAYDPTGVATMPTATSLVHDVATTPGTTSTTIDNEELPNGARFLYFVQGTIAGVTGGLSNFAPLVAENSAPVANVDNYTTPFNTALTGNVLANDTDVDSPAASLRAVLVGAPSHGSVVLSANGAFTYTPTTGFSGPDTFTYYANNGTWRNTGVSMSANSALATVTIVVQETVPPVVVLTIPTPTGDNGWFKTKPVLVAVSASDSANVVSFSCKANGAAIAVGSLSGIGTQNASGVITLATDGVYALVCQATDGAGNTGAAPGSTNTGNVKIDTKGPTVRFMAPYENRTYALNSVVPANYTCLDIEQSGIATCVGQLPNGAPIDTSSVGRKTFTVNTTDKAGNAATLVSTYTVK